LLVILQQGLLIFLLLRVVERVAVRYRMLSHLAVQVVQVAIEAAFQAKVQAAEHHQK
jgi:hypothetical protein